MGRDLTGGATPHVLGAVVRASAAPAQKWSVRIFPQDHTQPKLTHLRLDKLSGFAVLTPPPRWRGHTDPGIPGDLAPRPVIAQRRPCRVAPNLRRRSAAVFHAPPLGPSVGVLRYSRANPTTCEAAAGIGSPVHLLDTKQLQDEGSSRLDTVKRALRVRRFEILDRRGLK